MLPLAARPGARIGRITAAAADLTHTADAVGHAGVMVGFHLRTHDGDPSRLAVILPGRGYTAQAPLLNYAGQALREAHWSTRALVWEGAPEALSTVSAVYGQVVREAAEEHPGRLLIVGKSLGTLALPVAVELGLPGVWLTPLIREPAAPQVREALLRLAGSGVPALVAGGTGDRWWDSGVAFRSGADLVEIPGANHSLEVPGDWRSSLAILGQVTEAVARLVAKVEQR